MQVRGARSFAGSVELHNLTRGCRLNRIIDMWRPIDCIHRVITATIRKRSKPVHDAVTVLIVLDVWLVLDFFIL